MFKRKLHALDYQGADKFDIKDEAQMRNLIVWLEDQKIRHCKIEDREGLRNIQSTEWKTALQKYLEEVQCPVSVDDTNALVDWLLGFAVRLEYGDNADKCRNVTALQTVNKSDKSPNPLDSMDFDNPDFKAGVTSLASLLQIPPHQDHLTVLKAVCLLIEEKYSKGALQKLEKNKGKSIEVEFLPLNEMELGFETGDYISTEAAKILRLLHVRELRELQTQINEAIVKVQALTANPKTDTKLGKVGRM